MADKIDLLPGEEIVISSDRSFLTLTTKRVRCDSSAGGASRFVSIALEAVASCSVTTKSSPLLLLFAVLSLGIGLSMKSNSAGAALLIGIAVISVLAYLITRRKTICIASKGGEHIIVPARGTRDSIIEVFNAVEKQKLG